MNKYIFSILILFGYLTTIEAKPFTVVIDPGHGGSDVGATRAGIYESHITLDIALLVGELLETNHKDIKVAYTRKTDKKLLEAERMDIANKADGDIFVSIHVNSAYNEAKKQDVTSAHGVEVYIQTVENSSKKTNTLKTKSSIKAVTEDGTEISRHYDYLNNPTFNAIYEIKQAQIFNLSTNLAKYIGNKMGAKERHLRGVKQKSLYVTWQTTIPSVLVEVGYITNEKERKFMSSKEGKLILATGIYNGIIQYKNDFDQSKEPVLANNPNDKQKATTPSKDSIIDKANSDEVLFMWQIMTSTTPLKDNDYRFKKLKCTYYKEDNIYKYTYGSNTDYNEVLKLQTEVKKLFADAFIIAIKNGKRINLNDAR